MHEENTALLQMKLAAAVPSSSLTQGGADRNPPSWLLLHSRHLWWHPGPHTGWLPPGLWPSGRSWQCSTARSLFRAATSQVSGAEYDSILALRYSSSRMLKILGRQEHGSVVTGGAAHPHRADQRLALRHWAPDNTCTSGLVVNRGKPVPATAGNYKAGAGLVPACMSADTQLCMHMKLAWPPDPPACSAWHFCSGLAKRSCIL